MVNRDPGHYWPSLHAQQQQRYRGIDWVDVSETIANGKMKYSHKENCKLFIKEFAHYDDPVGVVANYDNGEILTVEYRYD